MYSPIPRTQKRLRAPAIKQFRAFNPPHGFPTDQPPSSAIFRVPIFQPLTPTPSPQTASEDFSFLKTSPVSPYRLPAFSLSLRASTARPLRLHASTAPARRQYFPPLFLRSAPLLRGNLSTSRRPSRQQHFRATPSSSMRRGASRALPDRSTVSPLSRARRGSGSS